MQDQQISFLVISAIQAHQGIQAFNLPGIGHCFGHLGLLSGSRSKIEPSW
jgi:hypothetical protein